MPFTFTINGHEYTSDPANVTAADGYRFIGYGYVSALGNLAADIASVAAGVLANSQSASASAGSAAQSEANAAASAAVAAEGAAFPDANPIVKGSADATKQVRFEVDGLTTGTTRVITVPDRNGTAVLEGKGDPIVSAAAINLDIATGDFVHITGATTITAITLTTGAERTVVFDGALTLTHNAASLMLPGGANIATAAGDRAIFRGEGSGNVRCIDYIKANGQAVVSPSVGAGDHEVVVHTGNGFGSTNTNIRRFTTTLTNIGSAITYADSAANGCSFTINETALYSIQYSDIYTAGEGSFGASVNSTQLTTSITGITAANRLMVSSNSAASVPGCASRVVKLSAGDVVRPHADSYVNGVNSMTHFAIRKVGNV